MRVQSATHGPDGLHLQIDGHRLTAGEKYTIIEMGYAILMPDGDDNSGPWLTRITETIPPDAEDSRGALTGDESIAVTSDPVVVALSYADWWARNSDGFKAGRSLPIPSREEAIQIVRGRRILNDFNRKYEGKLASEWQRVVERHNNRTSAMTFHPRLRFDRSQTAHWESKYIGEMKSADGELEERVEREIGPASRARGYLTRDEFLNLCRWKSKRTQKHCAANDEDFVRAVSAAALSASHERLRIETTMLLAGVDWPTASVILHFCSTDRYPILDFRALWSLSVDVPKAYDFDFWWKYTEFSRRLADETGVAMRMLDRALWQYSRENQPPKLARGKKSVAS